MAHLQAKPAAVATLSSCLTSLLTIGAIADSLDVMAAFYRARPTIGWVSPSVYRRVRKYGRERLGSSEEAVIALTRLAEKIRSATVDRSG